MSFRPNEYEGRPLAELLDDLPGLTQFAWPAALRVRGPRDPVGADAMLSTWPYTGSPESSDALLPADHPCVEIPGVVLEKYIGGGSQGVVYAGRVRSSRRLVAVKILPRKEAGVPTGILHEALICARIAHPNVPRVFQVQPVAGYWAIIMELVHGTQLEKVGLRPNDSLQCFSQLCDALAALARHSIVHRDVKPQNILVRQDGSPVLVDFSLAVDLEFRTDAAPRPAGTPYFMAPEAFSGAVPDPAWDAYSLGVTAAFIFHDQKTAYTSLHALEQDKRSDAFDRMIGASASELPDPIRTWILDLTNPDASRRKAAIEAGRAWAR